MSQIPVPLPFPPPAMSVGLAIIIWHSTMVLQWPCWLMLGFTSTYCNRIWPSDFLSHCCLIKKHGTVDMSLTCWLILQKSPWLYLTPNLRSCSGSKQRQLEASLCSCKCCMHDAEDVNFSHHQWPQASAPGAPHISWGRLAGACIPYCCSPQPPKKPPPFSWGQWASIACRQACSQ